MEQKNITRSSFKHNFLKQIIIRLDFQGVLHTEMEQVLVKVKPYLKNKGYNRYDERQISNDVEETGNIVLHSFINDNSGYVVELSVKHICIKVNTVKYIPFENYAETFMDISKMYRSVIDFFTVKRFGIRKINFCFIRNKEHISKYFNPKYFDCYSLFDQSEIIEKEKKEIFLVDDYKLNLLCGIVQGQLNEQNVYQLTLDTDIYIDDTDRIEKCIYTDENISLLNEKLFMIYKDSITDEFVNMLISEEDIMQDEIIGVDRNE